MPNANTNYKIKQVRNYEFKKIKFCLHISEKFSTFARQMRAEETDLPMNRELTGDFGRITYSTRQKDGKKTATTRQR